MSEKNRKQLQKTHNNKLVKWVKRTFFTTIAAFLFFFIANLLFPINDTIDYSTLVESSEGEMLGAYLNSDDKWRLYSREKDISETLKKCLINKEDKYFYYHFGINPLSIIRAVVYNIVSGKRVSGASTITMQVARMLSPKKRSWKAKLIEMFRAMQLEWKYSKNEILQLYLNLVPYGGNIEGVKSASLLYFNKMPMQLSLSEATVLTIIPNRPNGLNPAKNFEALTKEKKRWLLQFKKDKIFPPHEIEDAIDEEIVMKRQSIKIIAPQYCRRLKNMYPSNPIITGSIQMMAQQKVENIVRNYANRLKAQNINNACAIVLDNKTGKVICYVGSNDFNDNINNGQVDGIQAVRSPGSTLKPLLYATAMDLGLVTPKTIVFDIPYNFGGYTPQNYSEIFLGEVTIEYALTQSLNIPAVKLLDKMGLHPFLKNLKKAGFSTIAKTEKNLGLSVALGGCGATLQELTCLYATLANNGKNINPLFLHSDSVTNNGTQLVSKASAYMITEMLQKLQRPDFPQNFQYTYRLPKVAWKTGTSFGRKDAWSIGFNPRYTIGVWVGNFDGEGVSGLSGAETATPLLFDLFNSIDYNATKNWFKAPEEIDYREVCTKTGLLPQEFCTNTIIDYYIPGKTVTARCSHLKKVAVNQDSSVSFCKSCIPESGYFYKNYTNYAPEMLSYMEDNKTAYVKLPPHNPECSEVYHQNSLSITSLTNGAEYLIEKGSDAEMLLMADAGATTSKLYWYVNKVLIGKTTPGKPLFFKPQQGKTTITCSDDRGQTTHCTITVKYF